MRQSGAQIWGLMLAAALAGCAVDSPMTENFMVVPSQYETLSCREIETNLSNANSRVTELTGLMERSGNPVANAVAYNSEYARARAQQRYLQDAAARKGCELKKPEPPPEPPAKKKRSR